MSALFLALVGAVSVLVLAGCSSPSSAPGASPLVSRLSGAELFGAMAARFTNVYRAPKVAAARAKLVHAALSPSRVYSDTAVWTGSSGDSVRMLSLRGEFSAGRYRFEPAPDAGAPGRLGDSRHVVRLRELGSGAFQWTTEVDQAVGRLHAGDPGRAASAALVAAEVHGGHGLQLGSRLALPRTSAALGRAFTVDTLATSDLGDGTTAIRAVIRLDPSQLSSSFPAFARYLRKYVEPSRIRLSLADSGSSWLDASVERNRLTLRLRSRDGALVPLAGAPRAMPDSVRATVDLFTRVLFFDVGLSRMTGDLTFERSAHERALLVRFRDEPTWHFPLAARSLIRATLRRPFEGDGIWVRLALRDTPGGQTQLSRESHLAVKESAVLRWLGALGTVAMSDFTGESETEENRFIAEALAALQADILALPPARVVSEPADLIIPVSAGSPAQQ